MATYKVTEIIRRVERVLQDNGVRWPRTELQDWLNEAYAMVTLKRPDASAARGVFTCAAGAEQTLAGQYDDALALLDVRRNLGGSQRAVRIVSRIALDDQRPDWRGETPTTTIQHFMFDPRLPKEFMVYPPAADGTQIEVSYSRTPGRHALTEAQLDPDTGSDETILLDDIYATPLVDWILYRAYSKDADYVVNATRASAALTSFTAVIDARSQVDAAAAPTIVSRAT